MTFSNVLQDREKDKFRNVNNETVVAIIPTSGTDINPLAKYVEAVYSSGNETITYSYYESSSKATLYNTITVNYSTAQDTSFTSAEWS